MRSKAPLMMMEQMVMLLVFALAAALCLQAFVKSDQLSRQSEARDRAAIAAQNAAELIRRYGGDSDNALSHAAEQLHAGYDRGLLWLDYDENWNPLPNSLPESWADNSDVYRLAAQGVPTGIPGLRRATVSVVTGNQSGEELTVLFELNVSWQEDMRYE